MERGVFHYNYLILSRLTEMSREPIDLFGLIKDTGVETHGILLT